VHYRRALVTGGAGFIGSHLVQGLLDSGKEVIVLDDLSMGRADRIPKGAHLIQASLLDQDILKSAVKGVNVVFHLAAKVSVRRSTTEFHPDAITNILGTLSLLEALKESDVEKLIYASSMAVYGEPKERAPLKETSPVNPLSPYGISKRVGEMYCLLLCPLLKVDCVVLRYFNTYGPGQSYTPYVGVVTIFIRKLLSGEPPIIYGDGEQTRDFVHVTDLVNGTLSAMDCPVKGETFNIGSGKGVTTNHLANVLISLIHPDIRPSHIAPQSGELRYSIANIRKARRMLGYKPCMKLEGELPKIIEAVREEHNIT